MKTIQMTIDESLLAEVDQVIQKMNTTRSAFIREALQLALKQQRIRQLEHKHEQGYKKYPIEPGEFDIWEDEEACSQA